MTRVAQAEVENGKMAERASADTDLGTGRVSNFQGEPIMFRELLGDATSGEGTIVAGPFHNGDWNYWWVIETMDWQSTCGDSEHRWCVSLSVVAPEAAGVDGIRDAFNCCGGVSWVEEMNLDGEALKLCIVECLHSYGLKATVWKALRGDVGDEDEDEDALLEDMILEARQNATIYNSVFGFIMDRPLNAIGNDGWDFVAGEIGFR